MKVSTKIVQGVYRDLDRYRNISRVNPIKKVFKSTIKKEEKPFSEILFHSIKEKKNNEEE